MSDDEELRRSLKVLRKSFDEGKIVIAEHLADDLEKSLLNVRAGPDGEIDLATVDARVRSMARMTAYFDARDQTKAAASLADIQQAYFQRIESMFSGVHKFMRDNDSTPPAVASVLSRDEDHVRKNYDLIQPFVDELHDFWSVVAEPVRYHLQDMQGLKGVFGGDLFPSSEHNIASTCGVYLDTIVLTDPFMNSRNLFPKWGRNESVRMFIKHGLQVLNYRDLALAGLNPPIVVILPFESALDEKYQESLFSSAGAHALKHAERLFGREFSTLDELTEFVTPLDTPADVAARIADTNRLLFDADWTGNPEVKIKRATEEFHQLAGDHPGGILFNQCVGRMAQATDISWKSLSLGGVPLIDAPTSWQYYNWMLEYAAATQGPDLIPLHVSRGLQRLSETDMHWLGNIPADALIEIRKEGALDDLRTIVTKGLGEVVDLDPDNFFRSADKIYNNIEEAFTDHQKRLSELREKSWKFAGKDIGSWVVAGSVEVASALLGAPAWGLASFAISQLTDAPKLKDIPRMASELKEEKQALAKSATGLLFRHRPS